MEFTQKKAKNNFAFKIKPEYLEYSLQDALSKAEYTVEYDSISADKYEVLEKNDGYKNYAIYLLVLSIIFFAAVIFYNVHTNALLFLLGAAIMHGLYLRSKVKFTVLGGDYKIYIIHDDKHDQILEEIYKARKTFMLSKYGQVNLQHTQEEEIRKFAWLLKQKVITQKEFEQISLQLKPLEKKSTKKRVN